MTNDKNILKVIEQDLLGLSRALHQVASFLIAHPQQFIQSPLRELSEMIGVSEPSLIRFSRRYGFKGVPDLRLAVAVAAGSMGNSTDLEPLIGDKEVVNRDAKRAIAALAAGVITDDKSILIDSGSTVQFLADYLCRESSKFIMTTSLSLMLALQGCSQHRLFLTGGILRPNAMALGGRLAEKTLEGMSFDTVVLGADRIDPVHGLSTFSEEEAHINRAMLRASRRVIVLADSSKFGAIRLHRICDLSDVNVIISDNAMSLDMCQALRNRSIDLKLAALPFDSQPMRYEPIEEMDLKHDI